MKIADDKQSCVTGSVEGVNTAPTTVEPRITYLQTENIVAPDTTRNRPKATCNTGN